VLSGGFLSSYSSHTHLATFPDVHSRLNHPNIVSLIGAGTTSKGVRFMVLERLDGGTLTQMLGYDTRIRDRRRRFWRKKQFSYLDVLRCARSIADAMAYCQGEAIPGSMVLHRDLKPDNIGEWIIELYFCFVCRKLNPSSSSPLSLLLLLPCRLYFEWNGESA